MARWPEDARTRLAEAAMTLYRERGFDNVTVADIAKRAGVTERTFFRHFADKREVLFGGGHELEELLARTVAEAPARLAPLDAAGEGLRAAASFMEERRDFARLRQAIILANPELRERQLTKLGALAAAVAAALRGRGVDGDAAMLIGEIAVTIFKVAFARWVDDANRESFLNLIRESLEQLTDLSSGTAPASSSNQTASSFEPRRRPARVPQ